MDNDPKFDYDRYGAVNFNFDELDKPTRDLSEVEALAKREAVEMTKDFVFRLARLLLGSRDVRKNLFALLFLMNFNKETLGVSKDTVEGVAKKLGITKQTFHEHCQRVARELNQDWLSLARCHRTKSLGRCQGKSSGRCRRTKAKP